MPRVLRRVCRSAVCALLIAAGARAGAQGSTVRGLVTDAITGRPIAMSAVSVAGQATALTNDAGRYTLLGLRPGTYAISVRRIGYRARDVVVSVTTGTSQEVNVTLEALPMTLGAISVTTASRQAERVLDAPAAISVVDTARVRDLAATGQTPLLVADLPGVHILQSGMYDFNVNARGFNTTLNGTVLVLVDGRDVSVPMIGNQDWAGLAVLDEGTRVEMVRGPGSALYGANAFSGVLAINTPAIRDVIGRRLRFTAGDLSSVRADGSIASLAGSGRWAWRAAGGYSLSGSWDKARTELGYLEREYANAGIAPTNTPAPGFEPVALNGQTKSGAAFTPGAALGTPDPVRVLFGSLRLDMYRQSGAVFTAEGGQTKDENPVFTTGAGRSQVKSATTPWARAAWTSDNVSLLGYFSGRNGQSTQLSTGGATRDAERLFHLEGQLKRRFAADRGNAVLGASARALLIDSKGTVLAAKDDGRADRFGAVFGQVGYDIAHNVKLVAASRVDWSTLSDAQFSPKVGVVVKPAAEHAVRLTFNRGFRTPHPFERFLSVAVGAPLDLYTLEQGLRQSPLGPALTGVPDSALFTRSNAVPLLALGNEQLRPSRVSSWELGYKGQVRSWFMSADLFYNRINDFTSNVLPGANPFYGPWTAPTSVPAEARAALEAAVNSSVGGLTRLPDGTTALVLSYGNAGRATEWGAELAAGVNVTSALRLESNYTLYRYSLTQSSFLPGDTVVSNTPSNRANFSLTYHDAAGLRVRAGFGYNDAFFFRSALWAGPVPKRHTIDLTASRPLGHALSAGIIATNLFNERRYQLYGGSIVGRHLLATLTWTP